MINDMKYLQAYENFSLNESLFNVDKNDLQKMVNKISKMLPVDKILLKNNDFKNFMKKFSLSDGSFDMDKVPFISLNENIFGDFNNWYEKGADSKIVNILKKIFLFPAWIISYAMDVIIDNFHEGEYLMSSLSVFMLAIAIMVFSVLCYFGYSFVKSFNGIDKGVVISETKFVPSHTDVVPIIVSNGKSTTTIYNPVNVPDTWYFEVKDVDNNKIEKWSTSDETKLDDIEKGDTVNRVDYNISITL